MDKAARIFNWLGFIGIVVTFLALAIDFSVLADSYKCTSTYGCTTSRPYEYYSKLSTIMWICFVVYFIIMLIVAIWVDRQIADMGNVIAAGIVSLLFLGFIGGLLTLLCDNYGGSHHYSTRSYSSSSSPYQPAYPSSPSTPASPKNIKVGEQYALKNAVNSPYGIIQKGTKVTVTDVYSSSCLADAYHDGSKVNIVIYLGDLEIPQEEVQPIPSSSSESEKIKLLKEYKSLLDSGVITQEEFEDKKKELLSK